MIIATFNVNSVRARMPLIARWLEKRAPDVLCLQETKTRNDDFPEAEFKAAGYNAVYCGEKSYNGVAVVSRTPAEDVRCGFDREGADEGPRLITVRVNGIAIVNTYVPQGTDPASPKFRYKLEWLARLRKYFDMNFRNDDPLVWAGDFNVAPETIDVYDPVRLAGQIGFHPDERRALASVKEWGFTDVFRMHRKEAGQYSFWDYRARDAVTRGLGWRVDHIWATGALAAKSVHAYIDIEPRLWEKPSDHAPLMAEFDI
jgi:exodeoxyribonuclease-3